MGSIIMTTVGGSLITKRNNEGVIIAGSVTSETQSIEYAQLYGLLLHFTMLSRVRENLIVSHKLVLLTSECSVRAG